MFTEERKNKILEILAQKKNCTLAELCEKLYSSRSTIRRDVMELEEEGLIRRFYGGVSLLKKSSLEDPSYLRIHANYAKKVAIAKRASQFLKDDMVIFMDSSSTVYHLLGHLKVHKNLKVITNNLQLALELKNTSSIKTFITPGEVKHNSTSIIGEATTNFIRNFYADICFVSCKAFNEYGIFEGDISQTYSKLVMLEHSKEKILLCDSTKSQENGFYKLADYDMFHYLVTDNTPPPKIVDRISATNCKLMEQ